jgi:hypothetical protein
MKRTKIEHPSTILASMLQLSVISGDFSKEIRFVFKFWQLKNSTKHSLFLPKNNPGDTYKTLGNSRLSSSTPGSGCWLDN